MAVTSFLGLDIGGSSCKAVAFNPDGALLAAATVEYPIVRPRPGWMEFDTELQWRALREAVRRVTASEAVRRTPVSALGISTAGDATVPVDAKGRPLYNSIATPDPRGREWMSWWDERIGAGRIYEVTGQPLDGIYALNRVLWFRQAMPELYAATWKFLCWQDLVLVRLGLPPAIDHTLASRTMAFDIRQRCWSEQILTIADVPPDKFAPLVPSGTIIGELAPSMAEDLGLSPGVRVVLGGFDQACAALGAGVITDGDTSIGIGSVEAVSRAVKSVPDVDQLCDGNFSVVCHAVPGLFLVLGCSFAAGNLVRWYRDVLGAEERYQAEAQGRDVFEIISETVASEPSDLLVLPHFAGSFNPHRDPSSKAAILGLTLATSRAQLLRGLLEGTALELRLMVEALGGSDIQIGPVRAVGGGAKSSNWLQIKADVLDREITPMRVTEGGCLAAAMLAAAATGIYPSLPLAVEAMARPGSPFIPSEANAAVYNRRFTLYKRLYPAISGIHHELGSAPLALN